MYSSVHCRREVGCEMHGFALLLVWPCLLSYACSLCAVLYLGTDSMIGDLGAGVAILVGTTCKTTGGTESKTSAALLPSSACCGYLVSEQRPHFFCRSHKKTSAALVLLAVGLDMKCEDCISHQDHSVCWDKTLWRCLHRGLASSGLDGSALPWSFNSSSANEVWDYFYYSLSLFAPQIAGAPRRRTRHLVHFPPTPA